MSEIIKKVYYAVEIELASPLSVSNGIGEETDADLIRTSDNKVFIPGTSVAGALRNSIDPADREKIAGFSDGNLGKMSKIYISDLCFDSGVATVRDGVKLTSGKSVENKFDFEVLETGARGTMFISYLIRKEDSESLFQKNIDCLLNGIADGQIRFGANKNRGYGRLALKTVRVKEFDRTNVQDYIDFSVKDLNKYEAPETYADWLKAHNERMNQYCKVVIPLKLTGGISIRKYSARPNEADFMQITIGGENENRRPVIPGTSWNGAIRADALRILKELNVSDAEKHINQWFGHVNQNDLENKNARQSAVVIGESIIEDSIPLTMTRNKINRFDASTQDGALYTEVSYFGGTTNLEIMVRKSIEHTIDTGADQTMTVQKDVNYKAVIGLIMLVVADLVNGYVAIGGQTAVGRGIFEADGNVVFSDQNLTEIECRKALYQYLREVRNAVV